MQKKTLLKKISEIKSALTSSDAQEAIDVLTREAALYVAPKRATQQPNSDFILPEEVSLNDNAYALYTDGACRGNPGPGSWAYIIQNNLGKVIGQGADHKELTTNNKMELSAIVEGLKELETFVTPMHSIYVYTDSKYVVDGMRSWVAGWKKRGWKKADKKAPENLELWQSLDQLQLIANVSFNWVKGHSGHPQNEFVDKLANKALDDNGF